MHIYISWYTYMCITVFLSTGSKVSEQNEILVAMRFEPPTSTTTNLQVTTSALTNRNIRNASSFFCFTPLKTTNTRMEEHFIAFYLQLSGQKLTQSTGFEPVRAEPNRFLVYRLNHSATTANGKLGPLHFQGAGKKLAH